MQEPEPHERRLFQKSIDKIRQKAEKAQNILLPARSDEMPPRGICQAGLVFSGKMLPAIIFFKSFPFFPCNRAGFML